MVLQDIVFWRYLLTLMAVVCWGLRYVCLQVVAADQPQLIEHRGYLLR